MSSALASPSLGGAAMAMSTLSSEMPHNNNFEIEY